MDFLDYLLHDAYSYHITASESFQGFSIMDEYIRNPKNPSESFRILLAADSERWNRHESSYLELLLL
jgi:hypothetical protein